MTCLGHPLSLEGSLCFGSGGADATYNLRCHCQIVLPQASAVFKQTSCRILFVGSHRGLLLVPRSLTLAMAQPHGVEDFCTHCLAQVDVLIKSPESSRRKWSRLVDMIDVIEWGDLVAQDQAQRSAAKTLAEASPAGVACVGFGGRPVASPQNTGRNSSLQLGDASAQLPQAVPVHGSALFTSQQAIIEANKASALATRAMKRAKLEQEHANTTQHQSLLSQLS